MAVNRVTLQLDVHPATVHFASTTYQNLRVIVADGRLLLYRLSGSGAEMMYEREVTGPIEGSTAIGYDIPTEDGRVLVDRGSGCSGCGAKLGSIDLFPGQQTVMTGLKK